MSIRLYVLPVERNVTLNSDGAKYLFWRQDPDISDRVGEDGRAIITYGKFNSCIAAVEATATVHAVLASKADVLQAPANLDNTITNNTVRNQVRTFLETIGLPGNWVVSGTVWREIVRTVCGLFQFAQRYDGLSTDGVAFGTRITGNLSIQWQNIPQTVRDAVLATGSTLGYDLSFITPTMIVRNALKTVADMWGTTPFEFGLHEFNGGQPFVV